MNQALTPKALTLACALAMTAIASAQAADVQKNAEKDVHTLAPITVDEAMDKNGKMTLRAVDLETLPSVTGTMSEALRGNSFVQFDNTTRNGAQGAEITPPQISIRGSRNYENAFLINGLSNNSTLNPMGYDQKTNDPAGLYGEQHPGGDAQAIMLDTELLENLTVLSENVSAEYGNFMGGVINAQLRDAQTDRWHAKIWTRHTRDAWSKVHLTDKQEEIEYPTSMNDIQREFKNTTVGATFDGPLFDGKLGALISYQKTHASAPVYEKVATGKYNEKKSKRDKETFVLRLNTDKDADFYVNSSFIYSPYEANYYIDGRTNGKRDVEGGGWNWSLDSVANLSFGKWTNDLAVAQNESNWTADSNVMNRWGRNTHAISQNEGMNGDREQTQTTVNFKSALTFNPFELAASTHSVKLGVEALYTKAEYDIEGYTAFSNQGFRDTHFSSTVQGDKSNGILAGQEWLDKKVVNDAVKRDTDITSLGAFIEDSIQIERFTVRPGVRVEYDDLTENVNVAPRFALNADVLNDGRFEINAGYNRYFGNQILTEAIRAKQTTHTYRRLSEADIGTDRDWQSRPVVTVEGKHPEISDLDTPYSDEFVLGGTAKILNGTIFRIQGVMRDYKDQLSSKRVGPTTVLENGGETEYRGISFGIEREFDFGTYGKHYAQFGVTHSKLEGNSVTWFDSWKNNEDILSQGVTNKDYVLIDGDKTSVTDIPANNFNSDWVLTYTHRSSFMDDRLRSTILVRYESASDGLSRDRTADHDGMAAFKTVENDSIFNTDLCVDYDLIKTANSTLTVTVEALNLFDHVSNFTNTNNLGAVESASMGRQFWLGMSYNY